MMAIMAKRPLASSALSFRVLRQEKNIKTIQNYGFKKTKKTKVSNYNFEIDTCSKTWEDHKHRRKNVQSCM